MQKYICKTRNRWLGRIWNVGDIVPDGVPVKDIPHHFELMPSEDEETEIENIPVEAPEQLPIKTMEKRQYKKRGKK